MDASLVGTQCVPEPREKLMATLTARLDEELKEAIVRFWKAHGAGPSSAMRHVAEEWWAMQQFPLVVFREGVSGRRAALRDGPDVWEVVAVARDYAQDSEGLREYFAPFVAAEAIEQALAYAERFPQRIDAEIADNLRVEKLLQTRDSR